MSTLLNYSQSVPGAAPWRWPERAWRPPEAWLTPVENGEDWLRIEASRAYDSALLGQRLRALVVEDEALVALSVCDVLAELGLEVVGVVARAEDAVAKADTTALHLVIMDVRLQGERDGIWASNMILATYDLPVIYMTACQDSSSLKRLRSVPSAAILFKPFSIPSLTRVVNRTLRDFYGD